MISYREPKAVEQKQKIEAVFLPEESSRRSQTVISSKSARDQHRPSKGRSKLYVSFFSFNSLSSHFQDANLIAVMAKEFPLIDLTILELMQTNPTFKCGLASADMTSFIHRIEDADPNSSAISEDDSNQNWGHYQFTGGSMTCSSVLASWESIGSTNSACALIAAAIKTCRVARYLCTQHGITADSYLSDHYLEQVFERILVAWKDASGVSHLLNTILLLTCIGHAAHATTPWSALP